MRVDAALRRQEVRCTICVVSKDPRLVHSLYVHVPFCARKCEYCAFYSAPGNSELMDRFVKALLVELERVAPQLDARTIFFGGGTPSLLTEAHWQLIFEKMHCLGIGNPEEWTVECNPATVSTSKARALRSGGVNRVSLGVQSLDEKLLHKLGRIHDRQAVFQSYDVLRGAGFENINLDVMFAIPGQTIEAWDTTLTEVLAMDSEHLACYEVIYEEDTPLFEQMQRGEIHADEDLTCRMYERLLERSAIGGFQHYEVANFAKARGLASAFPRPKRCEHNVNYWKGGAFFGLGPSASSFVDGVRFKNVSNTQMYCSAIEAGGSAVETHDELAPLGRAGEIAAFGLRMAEGWRFDEFRAVTGFDLREHWASEMRELLRLAWGRWDETGFGLTELGMRFADAAGERFLR